MSDLIERVPAAGGAFRIAFAGPVQSPTRAVDYRPNALATVPLSREGGFMFDTELVLIEDAAAALGVSTATLREWCRNGTFPCVKHSGKRRVWLRADWIKLWLAGSDLEVTQLPDGGRVVRPTGTRSTPEERIGGVVNV